MAKVMSSAELKDLTRRLEDMNIGEKILSLQDVYGKLLEIQIDQLESTISETTDTIKGIKTKTGEVDVFGLEDEIADLEKMLKISSKTGKSLLDEKNDEIKKISSEIEKEIEILEGYKKEETTTKIDLSRLDSQIKGFDKEIDKIIEVPVDNKIKELAELQKEAKAVPKKQGEGKEDYTKKMQEVAKKKAEIIASMGLGVKKGKSVIDEQLLEYNKNMKRLQEIDASVNINQTKQNELKAKLLDIKNKSGSKDLDATTSNSQKELAENNKNIKTESDLNSQKKILEQQLLSETLKRNQAQKEQNKLSGDSSGLIDRLKGRMLDLNKSMMSLRAATQPIMTLYRILQDFTKIENAAFELGIVGGFEVGEIRAYRTELLKTATNTRYLAEEIANAQSEVVKTGATLAESEKIIKATIDLSTASYEDLRFTTDAVNKVMVAYNIEAEKARDVTNTLYNAVKNTPLSFRTMDESMRQAAPAFGTVIDMTQKTGLALEEYKDTVFETQTALTGMLSLMGKSGSMAGTTLKMLMSKSIGFTPEAANRFNTELSSKGVNLTSEEFSQMMIEDVDTALEKLSSLYDAGTLSYETIAKMFGHIHVTQIARTLSSINGDMETFKKRINEGSDVSEDAGKAMESWANKLKLLQNEVRLFKAPLLDVADTIGVGLIDVLRGVTGAFSDLSLNAVSPVISGLTSYGLVIGGTIIALDLFGTALTYATTQLAAKGLAATSIGAISLVSKIIPKLLAFITGPIGIAIGVIGAGYMIWKKTQDAIAVEAQKFNRAIGEMVRNSSLNASELDNIRKTINKIGYNFESSIDMLKPSILELIPSMTEFNTALLKTTAGLEYMSKSDSVNKFYENKMETLNKQIQAEPDEIKKKGLEDDARKTIIALEIYNIKDQESLSKALGNNSIAERNYYSNLLKNMDDIPGMFKTTENLSSKDRVKYINSFNETADILASIQAVGVKGLNEYDASRLKDSLLEIQTIPKDVLKETAIETQKKLGILTNIKFNESGNIIFTEAIRDALIYLSDTSKDTKILNIFKELVNVSEKADIAIAETFSKRQENMAEMFRGLDSAFKGTSFEQFKFEKIENLDFKNVKKFSDYIFSKLSESDNKVKEYADTISPMFSGLDDAINLMSTAQKQALFASIYEIGKIEKAYKETIIELKKNPKFNEESFAGEIEGLNELTQDRIKKVNTSSKEEAEQRPKVPGEERKYKTISARTIDSKMLFKNSEDWQEMGTNELLAYADTFSEMLEEFYQNTTIYSVEIGDAISNVLTKINAVKSSKKMAESISETGKLLKSWGIKSNTAINEYTTSQTESIFQKMNNDLNKLLQDKVIVPGNVNDEQGAAYTLYISELQEKIRTSYKDVFNKETGAIDKNEVKIMATNMFENMPDKIKEALLAISPLIIDIFTKTIEDTGISMGSALFALETSLNKTKEEFNKLGKIETFQDKQINYLDIYDNAKKNYEELSVKLDSTKGLLDKEGLDAATKNVEKSYEDLKKAKDNLDKSIEGDMKSATSDIDSLIQIFEASGIKKMPFDEIDDTITALLGIISSKILDSITNLSIEANNAFIDFTESFNIKTSMEKLDIEKSNLTTKRGKAITDDERLSYEAQITYINEVIRLKKLSTEEDNKNKEIKKTIADFNRDELEKEQDNLEKAKDALEKLKSEGYKEGSPEFKKATQNIEKHTISVEKLKKISDATDLNKMFKDIDENHISAIIANIKNINEEINSTYGEGIDLDIDLTIVDNSKKAIEDIKEKISSLKDQASKLKGIESESSNLQAIENQIAGYEELLKEIEPVNKVNIERINWNKKLVDDYLPEESIKIKEITDLKQQQLTYDKLSGVYAKSVYDIKKAELELDILRNKNNLDALNATATLMGQIAQASEDQNSSWASTFITISKIVPEITKLLDKDKMGNNLFQQFGNAIKGFTTKEITEQTIGTTQSANVTNMPANIANQILNTETGVQAVSTGSLATTLSSISAVVMPAVAIGGAIFGVVQAIESKRLQKLAEQNEKTQKLMEQQLEALKNLSSLFSDIVTQAIDVLSTMPYRNAMELNKIDLVKDAILNSNPTTDISIRQHEINGVTMRSMDNDRAFNLGLIGGTDINKDDISGYYETSPERTMLTALTNDFLLKGNDANNLMDKLNYVIGLSATDMESIVQSSTNLDVYADSTWDKSVERAIALRDILIDVGMTSGDIAQNAALTGNELGKFGGTREQYDKAAREQFKAAFTKDGVLNQEKLDNFVEKWGDETYELFSSNIGQGIRDGLASGEDSLSIFSESIKKVSKEINKAIIDNLYGKDFLDIDGYINKFSLNLSKLSSAVYKDSKTNNIIDQGVYESLPEEERRNYITITTKKDLIYYDANDNIISEAEYNSKVKSENLPEGITYEEAVVKETTRAAKDMSDSIIAIQDTNLPNFFGIVATNLLNSSEYAGNLYDITEKLGISYKELGYTYQDILDLYNKGRLSFSQMNKLIGEQQTAKRELIALEREINDIANDVSDSSMQKTVQQKDYLRYRNEEKELNKELVESNNSLLKLEKEGLKFEADGQTYTKKYIDELKNQDEIEDSIRASQSAQLGLIKDMKIAIKDLIREYGNLDKTDWAIQGQDYTKATAENQDILSGKNITKYNYDEYGKDNNFNLADGINDASEAMEYLNWYSSLTSEEIEKLDISYLGIANKSRTLLENSILINKYGKEYAGYINDIINLKNEELSIGKTDLEQKVEGVKINDKKITDLLSENNVSAETLENILAISEAGGELEQWQKDLLPVATEYKTITNDTAKTVWDIVSGLKGAFSEYSKLGKTDWQIKTEDFTSANTEIDSKSKSLEDKYKKPIEEIISDMSKDPSLYSAEDLAAATDITNLLRTTKQYTIDIAAMTKETALAYDSLYNSDENILNAKIEELRTSYLLATNDGDRLASLGELYALYLGINNASDQAVDTYMKTILAEKDYNAWAELNYRTKLDQWLVEKDLSSGTWEQISATAYQIIQEENAFQGTLDKLQTELKLEEGITGEKLKQLVLAGELTQEQADAIMASTDNKAWIEDERAESQERENSATNALNIATSMRSIELAGEKTEAEKEFNAQLITQSKLLTGLLKITGKLSDNFMQLFDTRNLNDFDKKIYDIVKNLTAYNEISSGGANSSQAMKQNVEDLRDKADRYASQYGNIDSETGEIVFKNEDNKTVYDGIVAKLKEEEAIITNILNAQIELAKTGESLLKTYNEIGKTDAYLRISKINENSVILAENLNKLNMTSSDQVKSFVEIMQTKLENGDSLTANELTRYGIALNYLATYSDTSALDQIRLENLKKYSRELKKLIESPIKSQEYGISENSLNNIDDYKYAYDEYLKTIGTGIEEDIVAGLIAVEDLEKSIYQSSKDILKTYDERGLSEDELDQKSLKDLEIDKQKIATTMEQLYGVSNLNEESAKSIILKLQELSLQRALTEEEAKQLILASDFLETTNQIYDLSQKTSNLKDGLIDAFKESLKSENYSEAVGVLNRYFAEEITSSIIDGLVSNKFKQRLEILYQQLSNNISAGFNISMLASSANEIQRIQLAAEVERNKFNIIKDLMDYTTKIDYTANQNRVQYTSGSTATNVYNNNITAITNGVWSTDKATMVKVTEGIADILIGVLRGRGMDLSKLKS